jgi:hypothetical protein
MTKLRARVSASATFTTPSAASISQAERAAWRLLHGPAIGLTQSTGCHPDLAGCAKIKQDGYRLQVRRAADVVTAVHSPRLRLEPWIEAQRGRYWRHRSELGKGCNAPRKFTVGSRSRALPSMKTSPCKSPMVVASRTFSETQASLPRRAGSVRARERRWRSRRCGGGRTTTRRPDDIPPFPRTLASRRNARRLCRA